MADIETSTVSDSGFASTSAVGDYELSIDPTEEAGPGPNAVLAADYAACFLPAFRVAGQRAGIEDLGKIQIDVSADVDDHDDLESIAFEIHVAADFDDETATDLVQRAEGICHVHSALREGLHADVTVHPGAF